MGHLKLLNRNCYEFIPLVFNVYNVQCYKSPLIEGHSNKLLNCIIFQFLLYTAHD